MLIFKRSDAADRAMLACLYRWENLPHINECLHPNYENGPLPPVEFVDVLGAVTDPNRLHFMFGEKEGEWLGYVDLQFDMPALVGPKEGTGWISICIGEETGLHKGYGREAMAFIEQVAREAGLSRIEMGVLEFNEKARKMYEAVGYRLLTRIENFCWKDGRQWADIRLEKPLPPA